PVRALRLHRSQVHVLIVLARRKAPPPGGAFRWGRAQDPRAARCGITALTAGPGPCATRVTPGGHMRMRLLAAVLAILPAAVSAQNGPVGRWKTIDDETGRVKSIVEIEQAADGTLRGTVAEVLHSDRGPNPTCDKCEGANKGKPV